MLIDHKWFVNQLIDLKVWEISWNSKLMNKRIKKRQISYNKNDFNVNKVVCLIIKVRFIEK